MLTGKGPKKEIVQSLEAPLPEAEKAVDLDQNKENLNMLNREHESNKDLEVLKDSDSKHEYNEYKETDLQQEGSDYEHGGQDGDEEEIQEIHGFDYNGTNAQDNVVWLKDKNIVIYTSGCDIIAQSDDGSQYIFEGGHASDISALAVSYDNKLLASCSATIDGEGTAPIILWNLDDKYSKRYELRSHEIGVKNLLFSKDGDFLISQSCNEERSLVVWDVEDGIVIKSTICPMPYSGITLLEGGEDCRFMFATVGKESYRLWKVDGGKELLFFDVDLPENDLSLTAICSTPVLGAPYNASVVMIGTVDGDVIINNPDNGQYLAKVNSVMGGSITLIESRGNGIILADDAGNMVRHSINADQPLFTEPGIILSLDAPVSAISFDENLEVGQVGTVNNRLSFVNWKEGLIY